MRPALLLAVCALAFGQTQDPAYQPLSRAYEALRARDYDTAVRQFDLAIQAAPDRAPIRTDLAYTYLKIGETELGRDQFREAMRLDPSDNQVALEYAFLCHETGLVAEARAIFDRVRKTGNRAAEAAFQNIDKPLEAGLERWKKALLSDPDNIHTHVELAALAERRGETAFSAEHYEKAWRLQPDRRELLLDLGRVWKALGRADDAGAALLAASRGGQPRAADRARELLPERYPFVSEFRRALDLDPSNVELRRELAYLLLRMDRQAPAETEFQKLLEIAPGDMLAATQLGFLLQARGDTAGAQPLFERVLTGKDEDLANRVRAVLRLPQVLQGRAAGGTPSSIDAWVMAERSIQAGFMKDAARYLQAAHENDPGDFNVILKLGWTHNILRQDKEAFRWFSLARKSPDPRIAAEAETAWKNLRSGNERFRFSGWVFPLFSTRWHHAFSYGQVKLEVRTGIPVRPYLSVRVVGDTRLRIGGFSPQALSESAVIVAGGLATVPWRGMVAWGEAGQSVGYLTGKLQPDYRGGVSVSQRFRRYVHSTFDAVYVSRFDNDVLAYSQNRAGLISGPLQVYWNGNATVDRKRQPWANFWETGPGLRIGGRAFFTVDYLRGSYLLKRDNPRQPLFFDLRAGMWYAFSY